MNETGNRIVNMMKNSGQRATDMTQNLKKLGEVELQSGIERLADHFLREGQRMGEKAGVEKGKKTGLYMGAAIGIASGVIGGIALTALTVLAVKGVQRSRREPFREDWMEDLENPNPHAILDEKDLPTDVPVTEVSVEVPEEPAAEEEPAPAEPLPEEPAEEPAPVEVTIEDGEE